MDDALKHPTWNMGAKITIDSSTLMNKGLEVIEAHELFDVDYDRVDVVVHPQSVIHGMVEFTDGATIAQLSHARHAAADRARARRARSPRRAVRADRLDEAVAAHVRAARCRCLPVPGTRLRGRPHRGGSAAVLSGANEVAVAAFLDGRIPWTAIAGVDAEVLAAGTGNVQEVEDVLEADRVARERCTAAVERLARPRDHRSPARQ